MTTTATTEVKIRETSNRAFMITAEGMTPNEDLELDMKQANIDSENKPVIYLHR
jgi:hypothetical protein